MKFFTALYASLFLIVICLPQIAKSQYQYISPLPGSTYHYPETNIILKNGAMIDVLSLNTSLITLTGSLSGLHTCRIALSTDGKTIVVYPIVKFNEGESVFVNIADGIRKKNGTIISGVSFHFDIHPVYSAGDRESIRLARKYAKDIEFLDAGFPGEPLVETTRDLCPMPDYTITSTGNELKQDVFYYNFRGGDGCFNKSIISNEGDSIYGTSDSDRGIGFTINRNGYLTFYDYIDSCFDMMDSSYNVVKQYFMGNGYRADEHDFLVFPDGKSFMLCYDTHPNLDLSDIGGLDTVDVIGCVIQELDADQNVIFQWRTWDYMQFTDAIAWAFIAVTQGQPVFDWIHANSMDFDVDGNLLLSSRHLCEITKIDLTNGDMIWRMGGNNNQFTFIDDPDATHFSGQHNFRRLASGNYTLFNNGNNVTPNISSAKEYQLDQVNKVATMVWKYKHPMVGTANVFAPAMGSVQRLSNGNTFIDWGLLSSTLSQVPRFSEVDAAGNIVWEFNFNSEYYISYRANKFDWNRCTPVVDSMFQISYISSDSAILSWAQPNFNSSYIFQYKLLSAFDWIAVPVVTNNITLDNLQPDSTYEWRVQSVCAEVQDSSSYSGVDTFSTLSTVIEFVSGEQFSIAFYPNPAIDLLTVSIMMKENSYVTILLTNLLGQVSLLRSFNVFIGSNENTLDLRNLQPGIYLVTVKDKSSTFRKQLVVK